MAATTQVRDQDFDKGCEIARKTETGAAPPGGIGSVHAFRLGIEPFAELGTNSSSLSGSGVDPYLVPPHDPRIGPGNHASVSGNRRPPEESPLVSITEST